MSVVKDWNEPNPPIWETLVDDGAYHAKVVRLGESVGKLLIWRKEDAAPFFEQDVHLSYGARFGPDVSDVAVWQDTIITIVDADIVRGKFDGKSEADAKTD